LASKFGQKSLAKGKWPAQSPGLNPCDYFLWGYLKDRVNKPLPKTLDDLKVNIEREIRNINQDVLKSTFLNFRKRLNLLSKQKVVISNKNKNLVYFKVSFIKNGSFLYF